MILGEILAKIGHAPLDTLLREKVLDRMGLANTTSTETSEIPDPVLHSFSSERRVAVGIPPGHSFYEEATFWNAQWGTPIGANETTDISDMATTAAEVGTGALLSKSSYQAMTDPNLLGFGHLQPNCAPSCFKQTNLYNFGLGVVRSGSWLLQDPLLSGVGSTEAYLPAQKIAIAVVVTFLPGAFDCAGELPELQRADIPSHRCVPSTQRCATVTTCQGVIAPPRSLDDAQSGCDGNREAGRAPVPGLVNCADAEL